MKQRLSLPILRIVIIFVVFSGLWIFYSDRLVAQIFTDEALFTRVQTYKGWFFVLVTAILLYWLIYREEFVRKKVENDLRASQSSFQELFANNPMPMWVYDSETLHFLAVNGAAIQNYGYSAEEFLQMTILDIRPPEEIPALHAYLAMERPALRAAGYWRHLTKGGRELIVQVVSHQMRFAGRDAFLVTAEDQTYTREVEIAYKGAEQKLIAAEDRVVLDESRLETLLQLSQMVEAPLQVITEYMLVEAARLTGSKSGFLAYRQDNTECFQVYSFPNGTDRPPFLLDLEVEDYDSEYESLRSVIQSRQPMKVSGLDGAGAEVHRLLIPVIADQQVVAVAGMQGQDREYEDADQRQLTLLVDSTWKLTEHQRMLDRVRQGQARLMAAVESLTFEFWMQDKFGRYLIQNPISHRRWGDLTDRPISDVTIPAEIRWLWQEIGARAIAGETIRTDLIFPGRGELGIFDTNVLPIREGDGITGLVGLHIDITALKQRERELQTMVTTAASLRAATRPEEIAPVVLENVAALMNVDAACLIILETETAEFRVEQASGKWQSLTGQVVRDQEPTLRKFLQDETRSGLINLIGSPLEPLLFSGHELHSAVCVPLVLGPSYLGAICVGSQSEFLSDQIGPLKAVADIAASALNRAILNEQAEVHLQRLTALRSIDLAITSSLDVRVTLNIMLTQISTQLEVDAADFLLYTAPTQTLTYAVGRGGVPGTAKTTRTRLGEGLAGRVALERQMKVIPALADYPDPVSSVSDLVANGFVYYIGVPLIAKAELKGVLQLYHRRELHPNPDWFDFLQALSSQAAIAIDNAELFDQLQHSNNDLTMAYDATIEGWSRALELRDQEKEGHNNRVADMTVRLAKIMDLPPSDLVHIRRGVLLHDIGKMAVPDHILLKAGPLTDDEWQIMRLHPQHAYEMLSNIPYLRPAIDIPFSHHERWDGMGYPRGLSAEEIPMAARLFSLVDIWDALRNERPYRTAWNENRVLEYIRSQAGRRLDPDVVAMFLSNVDQFR